MTSGFPGSPPGPLEIRLLSTLAWVDGHVKFAETKNVALLAANAALVAAVIQALTAATSVQVWIGRYLFMVAVACALSGCVTLLSFLPVTQIPWPAPRKPKHRRVESSAARLVSKPSINDNLLFFGDIQKHNRHTYAQALATALGVQQPILSALEEMYAEQIVINATIASRKFSYFKIALWMTLFGILTPVIAGCLLLYVTAVQDWSS